ncbi:MAG: 4-hydroxybenzoyl-CoA thioesterase [Planctomycetota bacterium]|jgi:4-hydroxybenzoyl-CoA thioesterase
MSLIPKKRVFTTQFDVRFGDVDPAGIAFYPKIYDMIHRAMEEMFDVHVGRRYYYLIARERIGFPLVSSAVEFKSPLRFGDRPIVRITTTKVGNSSLGLHYVFTVDERVAVDAHMTVVCCDLRDLSTMQIPDEFRACFEEIMEEE